MQSRINYTRVRQLYCYKAAFTLAEVLITLGIIGVVAAMTIHSLITSYKAHSLKSQYLKAYSEIYQIVKRMRDDEIVLDSKFLSQFKYYVTGSIYCGISSTILYADASDSPCFYKASGLYKTYDGKKTVSASIMDDGQYVLADGTNVYFEWDTVASHFDDAESHKWIWVDINGYKNPPNRWGYDLFTFQVIDDEVLAFGDDGTYLKSSASADAVSVDTDTYCNLNVSGSYNGLACSYLAKSDSDYFKRVVKNLK